MNGNLLVKFSGLIADAKDPHSLGILIEWKLNLTNISELLTKK